MKTTHVIKLLAITVCALLTSCAVPAATSPSVSLQDSIIYAAKAARAAGASELTYEATVTTNSETQVSVVVPIGPVAPTIGGKYSTGVGSKITIKVPIKTAAAAKPTGQKFEVNNRTLETQLVQ